MLISTAKFAEAGYITVFDDKVVNIYNASDTKVIVTMQAILRGWLDKVANLHCIPLVPIVLNNNTNTVLARKPPTKFLPDHPPPTKAIHNVYKSKMQLELFRYLHVVAGFPIKPTWRAAIKNKQFASWPGLTVKAVAKHYPESKETIKGHGQKRRSGLCSTKPKKPTRKPTTEPDSNNKQAHPSPPKYDVFIKVFSPEEEGNVTTFANQTGRFQIKLRQPMHHGVSTHGQQRYLSRTNEELHIGQNDPSISMPDLTSPKHHILDKKCLEEFKATIKKNNMTY